MPTKGSKPAQQECPYCDDGTTYAAGSGLSSHVRYVHPEHSTSRGMICPFCGVLQSSIAVHVQTEHPTRYRSGVDWRSVRPEFDFDRVQPAQPAVTSAAAPAVRPKEERVRELAAAREALAAVMQSPLPALPATHLTTSATRELAASMTRVAGAKTLQVEIEAEGRSTSMRFTCDSSAQASDVGAIAAEMALMLASWLEDQAS